MLEQSSRRGRAAETPTPSHPRGRWLGEGPPGDGAVVGALEDGSAAPSGGRAAKSTISGPSFGHKPDFRGDETAGAMLP